MSKKETSLSVLKEIRDLLKEKNIEQTVNSSETSSKLSSPFSSDGNKGGETLIGKNQLKVTFPKMTLKEIFEASKGKTEKGSPLIWNFENSWVRSEPFFDTETTREGTSIIDLEIIGVGKNWDECKELAEKSGKRMLNFAELVYLIWKHEDIMRPILEKKWTWVFTPVAGDVGDCVEWRSDGPLLGRRWAGRSFSYLGLLFSCIDL